MKFRLLLLGLAMTIVSIGAQAQKKEITKFMGIPIDGTKTAMIQKLRAKGFTYNALKDELEGEFNGRESVVKILTNKDKVWRIAVIEKDLKTASEVKSRFNTLCYQFERNHKYVPANFIIAGYVRVNIGPDEFVIPNDVDVYYEIELKEKRFKASYFQLSDSVLNHSDDLWSKRNNFEITTKQYQDSIINLMQKYYDDNYRKRLVWFEIQGQHGQYTILIFYDNENNESNGEDL